MQKDFAYVKKCLSLEFYVQCNTSYSILDTIADEKETQEVFSKNVHSFSETFLLLLVRASPQFFPFPVTALWTEIAQRGNGWNVSFQNCWTPCLCPEGTLTFLNSNLHSPLDVAPALSSPFSLVLIRCPLCLGILFLLKKLLSYHDVSQQCPLKKRCSQILLIWRRFLSCSPPIAGLDLWVT